MIKTSDVSLKKLIASVTIDGMVIRRTCGMTMQPHHPPIGQAERLRRLILAARDRLQPAAQDLGQIGRDEHDEDELDADELVEDLAVRQEQRQQEGRHEEQGDERHAADRLDIGDRDEPRQSEARAPRQSQEDGERKGEGEAGERKDEG